MKKYFGGSTLPEIGRAFDRIDSDNNDSLTWVEFTAETKIFATVLELKAALETSDGLAELKAVWDTLDKDGDGMVSSK
jgi:Ca2+-binding EF-hand superfamily protein